MLKKLRLTNFKAFGDPGLEIEPGLITVLIGPNGTGKSSVLQALLLLKQQEFEDSVLVPSGRFADFGTYQDLVHRHNNQLSMQLEILIENPSEGVADYYGAAISDNKRVLLRFARHDAGSIAADGWRSRRALTEDANMAIRNEVQHFLRNFILIPTMRGFVQLRIDPAGVTVDDMPSLNYPDAWSRATASLLAYKGPILPKVSPLIGRIIGSDAERPKDWLRMTWVHRDSRSMVVPESETESPLIHEGFGSNQLVVLLTWLTFANTAAVVGIEEPEIHLHPKAQGELARVLAEFATQEQKQLMLTTHSEHILTSLLIQVAAGVIKPEELAIYSFARDKRSGEAGAERLQVTSKGAVKGGLTDFFEVEWAEVREYVEALSKR